MTAQYGKVKKDLIAISKCNNNLEKVINESMYEFIWTINEKSIDDVIKMLIDCKTLRIHNWRIRQIRDYYEISDNKIIEIAREKMKINIYSNGEQFKFAGIHPGSFKLITEESNDILEGLVSILARAGQGFSSENTNPKV